MPASNKAADSRSIGRYQLKTIIGRGGMGLVYRASDTVMRRDVALKTIRGSADRMALELFRKECSVLASLSHPNIIEIFDSGEYEEEGESKPYFVMPLLPGLTLSELIRNSPHRLTVDRVTEIMVQTCRGLQAAHENGVVHRDLKPSNIFVMQDDSVKIIDFGMVHMVDTQNSMTIKGGTLPYMAPEQVQMQPASALSDIFSLGVVLYETLTRKRPFEGNNEADLVQAILHLIPPPASDLNPAVSSIVSRVVHKAMAKQPWYRFSSAREFSETLQKALRNDFIEIFDPVRIQPRIQRATKATDQGDYQFAGEILSELEAEGHLDPAIPFLRNQIERGTKQKAVQQLLDSARTRIDEEEYQLALLKIQEVLQIDPGNVSAITLKSSVENRRSQQKIDEWIRQGRQHLEKRAYGHARNAVQSILQIQPNDSRAQQMLGEIDRQEQEYQRLRTEKEQLYQSAMSDWQSGDVSGALAKLERVVDLDRKIPDSSTPGRPSVQSFYNQVRAEHEAIRNAHEEARRHVADRNFALALPICNQYLAKYPGHALFQALKFDVEERQRQERSARIAEIDRNVELEPDLSRRLNIINEALDLFPGEAHFEQALLVVRDKRDTVQTIVSRAREFEERGQFVEALEQWDVLRSVYPHYPGLDFEIGLVTQRRDQQTRAEARSRWVKQIDGLLGSADYVGAQQLLQDALQQFPGDPELSDLQSLARHGSQRAQEAQKLLAQARSLCAQNQYAEGVAAIRKAFQLDERNAILRGQLISTLLEQGRIAIEKDWKSADLFTQQILAMDPGNTLANGLQVLARDCKREDLVAGWLRQARQSQAAADLPGALSKLEQGLSAYPAEPRLKQLQETLQQTLHEEQRKREEFVTRYVDQARSMQSAGDLSGALARVEEGLAAYSAEPELVQLAAGLRRLIENAENRRREILDRCVSQARKLRDAGDVRSALEQVESGLTSYPDAPQLQQLQAELKTALEESRKKRDESVRRWLSEATQLQAAGKLDDAITKIERGLASYPGDESLLESRVQVEQLAVQRRQVARQEKIDRHVQAIRGAIAGRDWPKAEALLQPAQAEFPQETVFEDLRREARNGQQQDESRAREEAQRVRDQAIHACLAHVHEMQAAGNLDAAFAEIARRLQSYPDDAALLQARRETEQLADRRNQALRQEKIDGHLQNIQKAIADRDWALAERTIQAAQRDFPQDTAFSKLAEQAREGQRQDESKAWEESRRRRKQAISSGLARSRELKTAGNLDAALAEIDRTLTSYPGDSSLQRARQELEQLADKRKESQRHEKQKRQVEIQAQEESRRQRELFILSCLESARVQEAAGDLDGALAQINRSLATAAADPRLTAKSASLQQAIREKQKRAEPEIVETPKTTLAGNLDTVRTVVDLPAQIRVRETAPTPEVKAVDSVLAPHGAGRRTLVLAAGAALIVLAIAIAGGLRYFNSRLLAIEVRTEPAGATLRVKDQSCSTPTCRFDLLPGQYQIEAQLKGFRSLERTVTIDRGKPLEPIVIQLDPEPLPTPPPAGPGEGTLAIRTDQGNADVLIDGVLSGRTDSSGRLRLPVDAKEHLIGIEKNGFQATAPQRLRVRQGATREVTFQLVPQIVQSARTNQVPVPPPTQNSAPPPGQSGPSVPPAIPKPIDTAALDWDQIQSSRDATAFEAYLKKYPGGSRALDAQTKIEALMWDGLNKNDINALNDFVRKYPRGAHGKDATSRIGRLEWGSVDKRDMAAVEDFAKRHAGDESAPLAARQLEQLKEGQRIAAEHAVAERTKTDQMSRERKGITEALRRFSSALENKSTEEMNAIFPNMSARELKQYQQTFSDKQLKLEASLRLLRDPEIAGDKATADCERSVVTTYRGRSLPPRVEQVQIALSRRAGNWIITAIIAPPANR